MYKLIYGFAWVIALLPFPVIYLISDFFYLVIYKMIGYRRKVVRKNLVNSFPEKTEAEIAEIERKFYHYFCDMFLETIKTIHMSDEQFRKRMKFINVDIFDDCYDNNHSLILYLGHYCNWEWLTFGRKACQQRHPEIPLVSVYHPIENESFDKFYYKLRTNSKSVLVQQKRTLRRLIEMKKRGENAIYCFIADQATMWENMFFWMTWLNQETSPVVGPEKIARQTGFPVAYIDVRRVKRGYYEAEFIKMTDNPSQMEEYELSKQYMRMLEDTIRRDPAYWLWSHNRWKRTKEGMAIHEKKIFERNQKIEERINKG